LKQKIIIETKKKLFSNRVGQHSSIFRGSGIEFRDLQEYTTSDNARHINWKKSSLNKIYVNSFEADRELNIVLIYLNSGSLDFANKKQKAIEVLTALSVAAIESKESLTTFFYNNKEQKILAPSKKRASIDINYQIASSIKHQSEIDFKKMQEFVLRRLKRKSIIFIIGDFLDEVNLQMFSFKNEVYALIIRAKEEEDLKLRGELNILDKSSNESKILNISSSTQKRYNKLMQEHDLRLYRAFKEAHIRYKKIYTTQNGVDKLRELLNG